jgi:tetratricopeptide (TPR) repeat protein
MKKTNQVSQFMLEMYHLGAVSVKERKTVEKALSGDKELSLRYQALKQSNQELNRLYPFENLPVLQGFTTPAKAPANAGAGFPKSLLLGGFVPAVLAGAVFVSVYINTKDTKENPAPEIIGETVSGDSLPDLTEVFFEESDRIPKRRHFPIFSSGASAVGISTSEISSRREIDTGDIHAYNNRGLLFYTRGEYDRALADYDKAIELDPGYIHAYNNRGIVLYAMEEDDRAVKDYTEAIKLDPGYVYAYNNRGIVLYFMDDYDRAIEDYTVAIGLDYAYAFAYNNRGNAYSANGDRDRAIKDYTDAIRIDPRYARSYYNLGNEYYDLKNYKRAIENYTEAIRLDPLDAYVYNNRGSVYYDMGNYNNAIEDFDKALTIDPGYARAQTNLENAQMEKGRQEPKR